VERLAHEKLGSGEHNHEAGVLKDARQLLAEKRKVKASEFVMNLAPNAGIGDVAEG
jgi:hypothetical protein